MSIAAVFTTLPAVALAHPGHGVAAPEQGLLHQLLDHGGLIAVSVFAVGSAWLLLRRRRRG